MTKKIVPQKRQRTRSNSFNAVWSRPPRETEDYPNLVVMDNRVSGSITANHTRLPLWCLIYTALTEGWSSVKRNWNTEEYGLTADSLGMFLADLLEARGEFGRLLCMLADAERRERGHTNQWYRAWWNYKSQRTRIRRQLLRCVDALDSIADEEDADDIGENGGMPPR